MGFRRTLIVAAVIAATAGLAACSSGGSLDVTLEAESDAGEAIVVYDIGDGPVTETVSTPWTLPVELSGRFSVSLRVENTEQTGVVGCSIDYPGLGSPSAIGEAAADCDLDGRVSGNELSTAASSRGEERPGPDLLDEETGLTFELRATDIDGNALEDPALFEPIVFSVVIGPIEEPGQLRVESELTDAETRWTNNEAFRFDLEDLDADGNLVYDVRGSGGFTPGLPGELNLVVDGTLFLEDDVEYTFGDRIEFDLDPAEIEYETVGHLNEAVSVEIPSDWYLRRGSDELATWTEDGLLEPKQLASSRLRELFVYEQLSGSGSLAVVQIDRGLAFAPDADLATELAPIAGLDPELATVETAEIGELSTIRLASPERPHRELDLISFGDARFIIQIQADEDDESSWAAATAVRDSLAFDEAALPRLLHRLPIISSLTLEDDSLAQISIDVPANWTIADAELGVLSSPSGETTMSFYSLIPGDFTLDDLIAGNIDNGAAPGDFDRSVDTRGFEESAIARVDTDGDGSADSLALVARNPDVATVVELTNTSATPDIGLFEAMAATLARIQE